MATGTKGGLLEDGDRAQSIFKHQVLRHYLKMFIAMPGSTAREGRVVVLDGFAGRGRYPSGRPASGELILKAMLELRRSRNVASYFVEKDQADHEILARVIEEYKTQGLDAAALLGKVEDHLTEVIARASGVPLFLFLDPCGFGVNFDRLVGLLTGPRRQRRPQTEVLLNFSANSSRRIAGALARGHTDQRAMDNACGGAWWREVAMQAREGAPDDSFEPVVNAVVHEYARRVGAACRMMSVPIPVYRNLGQQPIYHLVFFTRSEYGLWVFGDAVGKARQEWLRHLGRLQDEAADAPMLWSYSDDKELMIEREGRDALRRITVNLRSQLADGRSFELVTRPLQIYGSDYGVATEATIIDAVKGLKDRSELEVVGRPRRPRNAVIRAPRRLG